MSPGQFPIQNVVSTFLFFLKIAERFSDMPSFSNRLVTSSPYAIHFFFQNSSNFFQKNSSTLLARFFIKCYCTSLLNQESISFVCFFFLLWAAKLSLFFRSACKIVCRPLFVGLHYVHSFPHNVIQRRKM